MSVIDFDDTPKLRLDDFCTCGHTKRFHNSEDRCDASDRPIIMDACQKCYCEEFVFVRTERIQE